MIYTSLKLFKGMKWLSLSEIHSNLVIHYPFKMNNYCVYLVVTIAAIAKGNNIEYLVTQPIVLMTNKMKELIVLMQVILAKHYYC